MELRRSRPGLLGHAAQGGRAALGVAAGTLGGFEALVAAAVGAMSWEGSEKGTALGQKPGGSAPPELGVLNTEVYSLIRWHLWFLLKALFILKRGYFTGDWTVQSKTTVLRWWIQPQSCPLGCSSVNSLLSALTYKVLMGACLTQKPKPSSRCFKSTRGCGSLKPGRQTTSSLWAFSGAATIITWYKGAVKFMDENSLGTSCTVLTKASCVTSVLEPLMERIEVPRFHGDLKKPSHLILFLKASRNLSSSFSSICVFSSNLLKHFQSLSHLGWWKAQADYFFPPACWINENCVNMRTH